MFHVKHNHGILKLVECLAEQGIVFSQTQEKQIDVYYKMLLGWNRKINLVSRTNTEETLEKNFISSFLFWSVLIKQSLKPGSRFADLGSGGGFPGIPLSIMMPEYHGTLVDSSRKKMLFLKKAVAALGLNTNVINKRVEEIKLIEDQKFDFIVALAFAPLEKLVFYAKPLLKKDGFVLTLKGKNYRDELIEPEQGTFKITPITIDENWRSGFSPFKEKTILRLEL